MFTKADIASTILSLARSRYGVSSRSIQRGETFEDIKFDKYDVLYMVMACEEYFDIHISQEEVASIPSVHSLIVLVRNKLFELGKLSYKKKKEEEEALEDAKSNDAVPVGKTEGDYECEDVIDSQEAIAIPAADIEAGHVIAQAPIEEEHLDIIETESALSVDGEQIK